MLSLRSGVAPRKLQDDRGAGAFAKMWDDGHIMLHVKVQKSYDTLILFDAQNQR